MSNGSEVARLLAQISAEYEAAERGLNGFTYGATQHEFIAKRMENMGQLHQELNTLVGSQQTGAQLVAEALNALPEPSQAPAAKEVKK